jgi:nucleoside-diphosphate-sugar epimerase
MSPEAAKVAFVTGANGVTGQYLLAQLAQEPEWTRVIATSRRPPGSLPQSDRVGFHQHDLNKDVDAITKALQEMGATRVTHFFHMAYIHHDEFAKQYEYNVPFFKNVLTAVEELNRNTLQRVVLQTGAKHYGQAYKAPPRQPITEDLGRLGLGGPPNFYYPQEDFMFALQEGKQWTWSVTRPFLISGVSTGTSWNAAVSRFQTPVPS